TLKNTRTWEERSRRALSLSGHREREKPCWRKPLRAKRKFRSSLCQALISLKCLLAWAHLAFGIYSNRLKKSLRRLSLLMRLMQSEERVARTTFQVQTTNAKTL